MYEQNFNPFAQNLAIIKGYFRRRSVLTLAILQIISIVLSIPAALLAVPAMNSFTNQMTALMGSKYASTPELQQFIRGYQASASASSVTSMIPSLLISGLIAAAFIIIYVKSRSDSPDASPYAGFNILYVLAVIELIIVCLAVAALLLLLISFALIFSFLGSYGGDELASVPSGVFVGLMIFLVVLFALVIFFLLFTAINQLRFVKSVRSSLTDVNLSNAGAGPYGVINVIYAIFSGFSVIFMLLYSALLGGFSSLLSASGIPLDFSGLTPLFLIGAVSSVVSMLYYIFTAKIALGYKGYINDIKNGYIPAYTAEDPAPVPPMNFVPAAQPTSPYTQSVQQPEQPAPQDIEFIVPGADPYTCPKCGAPVDSDAAFCQRCGNKLR